MAGGSGEGEDAAGAASTVSAASMAARAAAPPANVFSNYFDGTIATFNGEDKTYSSTKWAQDVEDNAEIFGWTPAQKLIIARRSLCGTAALWLKSEKAYKTYEELKVALQREFPDQLNIKEMHELMAARKKSPRESYHQYMLTMKELGKRAKFPDYVAIQYIIDGIEDVQANKMILYGVTTYSVLKEKLAIYEKIKMDVRKEKRHGEPAPVRKRDEASTRRCYNCGDPSHVSAQCPNGVKCFRCNQYGHIGNRCPMLAHGSSSSGGPKLERNGYTQSVKQSTSGPTLARGIGGRSAPSVKQRSAMFGSAEAESTNQEACTSGHDCEDVSETSVSRAYYSEVMQIVNKDSKGVKNVRKPVKTVLVADKCSSPALIDSGSDVNLISAELCAELFKVKCHVGGGGLTLTGLGRSQVKSSGTITTHITIDGQRYDEVTFHTINRDCMPYDIIIGHEFLRNVTLVMNEGCVKIFRNECEWLNNVNCFTGETESLVEHIKDPQIKEEAYQCVDSYDPVQVREAPLELKIVLKDEVPVSQRPRRLSYAEQLTVEKQVDEWLEDGIIQVSHSEYSSPLVLVKKKDGTTRVCIDYRQLNTKIVKDEYPLPVISDLIDRLSQARVFSVLDLKNGFFHLKVSKESVPYTSFVTHNGQYEFLRAPFGLSISPKYFMRFVNVIFRELLAQKIMMIFIDDIIIPAENEEEGLQRLKLVLEVAAQYGLRINWKKAKLLQTEIEYLGHKVRCGEVQPTTEKVDAVMKFPEPKTGKQLKSFLGLTSYFRKYIEGYAIIAKPLNDLLRKDVNFVFDVEQRNAFIILKEKLASSPVLKIFNPDLDTELHTDASSLAISAVLMQYHPGSGLHPVQYMSHKTNEAQSRWSSYELEAFAIIEAVKKFRHYLHGKHFKLITDCKAFQQTLRKKDLTAKVARWVIMLNEYDFEVEHRAGEKMRHADALSRNPYVAVVTLRDQIKEGQDQDDGLRAIKTILNEDSYKDYSMEGEILFKGPNKLLVIPKHMDTEIIRRVHGNGHFSKKKMKDIICQDYYIKDIDKKLEEFINACIPCLLATRKEGRQEGFLNPIEKDNVPLDTLHLDHVGSLTETRKQYNYILTVIDSFTKFVWLFPTKSTSSAETLNKIRIHQQTFGNPRRFITDRGTAFTSHEFEDYCREENIQHIKITTGIPRGNGQVERVHRIIIPMLTKLCIENAGVWYKHVGRVQQALNSNFQRSINTTPFNLLVGTRMRTKEDTELLQLLEEETAKQYEEARDDLRQKAKEQILAVQEENRKYFNRKRKESYKYKVGDLVAIKRTQFGAGLKLKAKYLGPYKITKVNANDRYDVEKVHSATEGPNRTSSSADYMKRWPNGYDTE